MKEYMTELSEKQVVNVCDGKILGYVIDFKVDPTDGRLTAIIVPGEGGFFNFKRCPDVIIPWEKICKIGIDVILVDIGYTAEIDACFQGKANKKKK